MTKKELYLAMKTDLAAITFETPSDSDQSIANVAIWRNQPSNAGDYTGPYPAVFVEFLNTRYTEGNSKAYQNYDPTIRLHLCLETSEDEDDTLAVFNFADAVYFAMQLKQYGDFAPMKRRAEDTVFSYAAVQDYIQDYTLGLAKDYGSDKRPATLATIDEIIINTDITNDI